MQAATLEKYTLIITEKPDAANRIASALDAGGKAQKNFEKGVPYYAAERGGKILVVPALGHLYTVMDAGKTKGKYPVFDLKWAPKHEAERGASRIKVWLQTITKLAKNADAFVDACDYDLEGSIIGYCILKYACSGKENEAKRMKYSTLTREELQKAYGELLPHLDFALIEAGLARHEVDWLYGINLSRALTSAAKNVSGRYATLSTGRVQGPTLRFLALRERSIQRFEPKPFWTLKVKIRIGKAAFMAEHGKKTFDDKQEAEAATAKCQVKTGEIQTVKTENLLLAPPLPFDLGALQSEAYRLFGYTPMRTSSIAQHLYLSALISYPRTSSQKLPPSIGYEAILERLARIREYTNFAGELLSKPTLKPVEGKRFDPAHPAIYPTGKRPEKPLIGAERNVFDLVVKRFLACFAEPAMRKTVEAAIDIGGERFLVTGRETLEQGWLRFYQPYARLEDKPLPPLKQGDLVKVEKAILEEDYTKPPARYNPGSLLRKIEANEIGTKATRAGVIQTLLDRKYVQGEKTLQVTNLGFEVTDVLRKYCPALVSVEFTRSLEEKMDAVQQGTQTKERVLQETVETLKIVTASLKENEQVIGEQLSSAIKQAELEEHVLGACPTCKTGKLTIIYSKKTGKRFAGCTNYFKGTCKTAYPLPQKGAVKPTGKTCSKCDTPTVYVWLKGKRPWSLCINPACSAKTPKKA